MLVVSPLIALMSDQVASIAALGVGLSAAYVTDKKSTSSSVRLRIKRGEYQIVLKHFSYHMNGEICYRLTFTAQTWLALLLTKLIALRNGKNTHSL